MKGITTQMHPYELRTARLYAMKMACLVARDVWFADQPDSKAMVMENLVYCPELSVKESCRVENIEEETATTVFTFRFEGGTVVRIHMSGENDWQYGFQWKVEKVKIRFYANATDSAYPSLAKPKKEITLTKEYFWQEGWVKNPLPINE